MADQKVSQMAGAERPNSTATQAVYVWCPECGLDARVVGCARFACPACGRIASTAACTIGYAYDTDKVSA